MLVALTEGKKSLVANKKLSKNKKYYCPSCKARVYLKKGNVMRPHFAHYNNDNCSTFTEGETEEHLKGKLALAKYFEKQGYLVKIEAYLAELKQRPDLLVEKNKQKIAIEFQCSAITVQKMTERTIGYFKAGYKVLWILGSHFHYHHSLTNLQKASLYYYLQTDTYLLVQYDAITQKIIVHHDYQVDAYGKMHCQKDSLILNNPKKISFKNSNNQLEKIEGSTWLYNAHNQLTKRRRYPSIEITRFLSLIYQKNENIVSIPIEIYCRASTEWMIQTYHMNWKYQLLIWIESHSKKEIITKNSLLKWLDEKIKSEEIIYSVMPGLKKKQLLKPHYEFLDCLGKSRIVKKLGSEKWSYQQSARRFRNLDDKMK